MALKLSEDVKGFTADYWKITDCNVVTGQVCMALFKDSESATSRSNMLDGRISIKVDFNLTELEASGMNAVKYAYGKVKESKMVPKKDDDGKSVTKDGKVIMEESNKFSAATDC
jgi:hypothetical protein